MIQATIKKMGNSDYAVSLTGDYNLEELGAAEALIPTLEQQIIKERIRLEREIEKPHTPTEEELFDLFRADFQDVPAQEVKTSLELLATIRNTFERGH